MYELRVKRHFDASHIVIGHPGKCAQLHGHRWVAEVSIVCQELNSIGLAIDFGEIKQLLDRYLPDHRHLNDVLPEGFAATAEGVSRWLFHQLREPVAELGGRLRFVRVWESEDCAAAYLPEEYAR